MSEKDPNELHSDADVQRHTIYFTLGSLLARGTKIVLMGVFARILTAQQVGSVALVLAGASLVCRILGAGIADGVKRYYGTLEPNSSEAFAALSWVASALPGILLLVLLLALGPPRHGVLGITGLELEAILILAAAQSLTLVPRQKYIAAGRPVAYSLYNASLFAVATISTFFTLKATSFSPLVAVAPLAITYAAFGTLVGLQGYLSSQITDDAIKALKTAAHFGVGLIPYLIFIWSITFVDRIIIASDVSRAAAAQYDIAYKVASVVTLLNLSIRAALVPRLLGQEPARANQTSDYEVLSNLWKVILGFAILCAAAAPEAVHLLAGAEYTEARSYAQLLVFMFVFHGVLHTLLLTLYQQERSSYISTATGIGALANLIANMLSVPLLGVPGAIISTGLGFGAAIAFIGIHDWRKVLGALSDSWQTSALSLTSAAIGLCWLVPATPFSLSTLLRLTIAAGLCYLLATTLDPDFRRNLVAVVTRHHPV